MKKRTLLFLLVIVSLLGSMVTIINWEAPEAEASYDPDIGDEVDIDYLQGEMNRDLRLSQTTDTASSPIGRTPALSGGMDVIGYTKLTTDRANGNPKQYAYGIDRDLTRATFNPGTSGQYAPQYSSLFQATDNYKIWGMAYGSDANVMFPQRTQTATHMVFRLSQAYGDFDGNGVQDLWTSTQEAGDDITGEDRVKLTMKTVSADFNTFSTVYELKSSGKDYLTFPLDGRLEFLGLDIDGDGVDELLQLEVRSGYYLLGYYDWSNNGQFSSWDVVSWNFLKYYKYGTTSDGTGSESREDGNVFRYLTNPGSRTGDYQYNDWFDSALACKSVSSDGWWSNCIENNYRPSGYWINTQVTQADYLLANFAYVPDGILDIYMDKGDFDGDLMEEPVITFMARDKANLANNNHAPIKTDLVLSTVLDVDHAGAANQKLAVKSTMFGPNVGRPLIYDFNNDGRDDIFYTGKYRADDISRSSDYKSFMQAFTYDEDWVRYPIGPINWWEKINLNSLMGVGDADRDGHPELYGFADGMIERREYRFIESSPGLNCGSSCVNNYKQGYLLAIDQKLYVDPRMPIVDREGSPFSRYSDFAFNRDQREYLIQSLKHSYFEPHSFDNNFPNYQDMENGIDVRGLRDVGGYVPPQLPQQGAFGGSGTPAEYNRPEERNLFNLYKLVGMRGISTSNVIAASIPNFGLPIYDWYSQQHDPTWYNFRDNGAFKAHLADIDKDGFPEIIAASPVSTSIFDFTIGAADCTNRDGSQYPVNKFIPCQNQMSLAYKGEYRLKSYATYINQEFGVTHSNVHHYHAMNKMIVTNDPMVADFTGDAFMLKLKSESNGAKYNQITPLLILAAPPYVSGFNGDGVSTTYGTSTTSGSSSSETFGYSAGASLTLGWKTEVSFFGVGVEAEFSATASYDHAWAEEHVRSNSITYGQGYSTSGKHGIVFLGTPVKQYVFDVVAHGDGRRLSDGTPREVTLEIPLGSSGPRFTLLEDFHNRYPEWGFDKILARDPTTETSFMKQGDPTKYLSRAEMTASAGTLMYATPSGVNVGFATGGQLARSISLDVSEDTETSSSSEHTAGLALAAQAGGTTGPFVGGEVRASFSTGGSAAVSMGTGLSYSGEVDSIDSQYSDKLDYSFGLYVMRKSNAIPNSQFSSVVTVVDYFVSYNPGSWEVPTTNGEVVAVGTGGAATAATAAGKKKGCDCK